MSKVIKGYRASAAYLLKDFGDFIAMKLKEIALFDSDQAAAMGAAVAEQIGDIWGGTQFFFSLKYIRTRLLTGLESCVERCRIELLNDFERLIASQLEQASVNTRETLEIASEITNRLLDEWRNEQFYIPRIAHKLARRDEEICRRIRLGNADELAREYGMSRQRIYQIVREHRAQRRKEHDSAGSAYSAESAANSQQWHATGTN